MYIYYCSTSTYKIGGTTNQNKKPKHFFLAAFTIVLIVSYTFLLCSFFLCATIYMFKNSFTW